VHVNDNDLLVLGATVLVLLIVWRVAWWLTGLTRRLLGSLASRVPTSRAWSRTRPLRAVVEDRYPRLYGFLAARFDARRFSGLPLTLMVLAAVYVGSLVAGLVEELLENEGLVRFDQAVNEFFQPYRDGVLVSLFSWITDLGGSAGLLGVAIVSTGFIWAHRRPHLIGPLWLSFLGAQFTTWAGKFVFARERPEFLTDVTALSPSFPSGHSTGAMAVYGFVAYAIARDLDTSRKRFEVVFWALVVVVLVGFSRILLSVHYASDVATGLLVGTFWLLVGFALSEHSRAVSSLALRSDRT
jgi:undecaprenyl-diphosphatase